MSSQPSLPTPGILQVPSKTQYNQDCPEEEDIDKENPLISDLHITDSGENVESVSLDMLEAYSAISDWTRRKVCNSF